jgi:hypothetical protein
MSECFAAQSLVATKTSKDERRFELTFVDVTGEKRTISLPVGVAADLAPVLTALAERAANASGAKFTKMPKRWAVGTAKHERLVLLQFDDDPPYGLDLEVAETLWREVREGQQTISRQRAPALQ